MLQLKNIVKNYVMGDRTVEALKGISLEFRKNEFVAILGPSGCGKTTMLNVVGGLDGYTGGDLVINGLSTKKYKDVDWDIYRNNSIGFVFQSYNLIPHQTAFANVELALTLAGKSRDERHKKVTEAFEKVGLRDQIGKKPAQMSGGQMQRVAIARAIVNNPDILLADEPTGALDSETSLQIMELLKEIAEDRLVIMVTHNPEIAEKYSTRIIKLLDGKVLDDSNPYSSDEKEPEKSKKRRKKISMSFITALSLSLKNLLTKKTRTILTAFAGSIGIIGIALILSLSSGMQSYVKNLERDTLSTYPLELQSRTMDMTGIMTVMMENSPGDGTDHGLDKVYANNIMTDMMRSMTAQVQKNDLKRFKEYIEGDAGEELYEFANTVQYAYGITPQIFNQGAPGGTVQVNPSQIFAGMMMNAGGMNMGANMGMAGAGIWTEALDNDELLHSQYDVIAGRWPEAYDEVVFVVSDDNEISDVALYSLGILDGRKFEELMQKTMRGEPADNSEEARKEAVFSYEEILSVKFKLLINPDYYVKENGRWADKRGDAGHMKTAVENAPDIKIVGIIRPDENAAATSINGIIGYTSDLTDYVINATQNSQIVKEQLADDKTNVFTGLPFGEAIQVPEVTIDDAYAMMEALPEEGRAQAEAMLGAVDEEALFGAVSGSMGSAFPAGSTYEENLLTLGAVDFENPDGIRIYPKDFESKKGIETFISDYNTSQENAGNDEYVIHYTDIVGIMTSSISDIINIISYVLIAFVAISLIVSSIMIAIITYISVLERTKEIGILRSIGASKKDITRVFNAETVIEGFVAGGMGVLITIALNFPINSLIEHLAGISGISSLPLYGAAGLIVISVMLTVLAGFIPSRMAAKKDPAEALRTD